MVAGVVGKFDSVLVLLRGSYRHSHTTTLGPILHCHKFLVILVGISKCVTEANASQNTIF